MQILKESFTLVKKSFLTFEISKTAYLQATLVPNVVFCLVLKILERQNNNASSSSFRA